MNEITITVIGSLTADPELRFTTTGTAVANFSVASNSRRFDKQTNGWVDGPTTFMRCNVWRQAAENIAESLRRGDRVVVTGQLNQRDWESREGEKRTSYELNVTEVGASLQFAQVKIAKAVRNSATTTTATDQSPAGDDEPPF